MKKVFSVGMLIALIMSLCSCSFNTEMPTTQIPDDTTGASVPAPQASDALPPVSISDNESPVPIPGQGPPPLQYMGHVEIFGYYDSWFYYSYPENGGTYYGDGLYRIRADGTGKTKLLETEEISDPTRLRLDFDNGWIYFANAADSYTLYKIRTDGAEKLKLNDDEFSSVQAISDGWVYYRLNTAADECTYRIRTDGTGREVLCEFDAWIIGVTGDWIYYQDYENDYLCLYKMRIGGTDTVRVADDLCASCVIGDWIYYRSPISTFGYQLHRMRADGTGQMQLDDYQLINDGVFFSDGKAYYKVHLNETASIRSLRFDGTGKTDFDCSDLYYILAVDDGWIYYQSNSTLLGLDGNVNEQCEIQGKVYMIRTDGSEKQEVAF